MGLLNEDGTPYALTGDRTQFDTSDPMNNLFNIWDQESIEIGGSPIYYFEVFMATSIIDPDYTESRSKVWSQYPTKLYAAYEPVASTNNLGMFGIDGVDEIMLELNARDVLNKLGHPPKIGSRIFTPHLREQWELIQVNTGGFIMWNVIRYEFICKRWQESTSTGEGRVGQPKIIPDVKII